MTDKIKVNTADHPIIIEAIKAIASVVTEALNSDARPGSEPIDENYLLPQFIGADIIPLEIKTRALSNGTEVSQKVRVEISLNNINYSVWLWGTTQISFDSLQQSTEWERNFLEFAPPGSFLMCVQLNGIIAWHHHRDDKPKTDEEFLARLKIWLDQVYR